MHAFHGTTECASEKKLKVKNESRKKMRQIEKEKDGIEKVEMEASEN